MALRDQPYLPLYIQDFLTDEKLVECSASATGVYIRIMCIMHKSERYGCILLKQIEKQSTNQVENFARKLVKHLPYTYEVILGAIVELTEWGVLKIDGDILSQKRMIKDFEISCKRAQAGKKGGKMTQKSIKNFAKAKLKPKDEANSEIENENENEIEDESLFGKFNNWLNKNMKSVKRMTTQMDESQFNELQNNYTLVQIKEIIEDMENWKPLLSRNKSVYLTARKWLKTKYPTQ